MPVMMDVVDTEAGDPSHHAFVEDLFHRCYGELVGLAALVLHDRAAAEDVVQDAFAGLYRRGELDDPDGGVGYLRRSVVNGSRGRLRRRTVAERPRPAPRTSPGEDPADRVVADDDARRVATAMARLPLRQRECVAACLMLGLTHTEAAGALGISPGSVKTHVHRGTRRLTDLLSDPEDDR